MCRGGALASCGLPRPAHFPAVHAAGEGEGAFEGDGFVATNPFHFAKVRERRAGKAVQGAKAMQELFGNFF